MILAKITIVFFAKCCIAVWQYSCNGEHFNMSKSSDYQTFDFIGSLG